MMIIYNIIKYYKIATKECITLFSFAVLMFGAQPYLKVFARRCIKQL